MKKDAPNCLSTGKVVLPSAWTTENKTKGACVLDPSDCEFGLTVTLWVKMDIDEVPTDRRRYFLSTDKDSYSVYHQSAKLWAEVTSSEKSLKASCDLSLSEMEKRPWMIVGFRWSRWEDEGLEVLVHGRPCKDQINSPAVIRGGSDHKPSTDILIGCRVNPTTSVQENFMVGGIDEVAFFTRRVRDESLIVALGGYRMLLEERKHLITTKTQLSTTTAFPPYDYASNMEHCSSSLGDENPFYKLADVHYPLRNLGGVSPEGSVVMAEGRMGPGTAPQLENADSLIKLGNFNGKCPAETAQCNNGFAVSAWVYLPKELPDKEAVIMMTNMFGTSLNGWAVVWSGKTIQLKVTTTAYSVPAANITRGSWFNFAFSSLSGKGGRTDLYISGKKVAHEQAAFTLAKLGDYGAAGDFFIGQKTLSVPKLRVGDVVVWQRFLYEFERHRYLGLTATELLGLEEADAYWSADHFMLGDHTSLPLYCTKDSTVTRVAGPNGPNRAYSIKPDGKGWFLLGNSWETIVSSSIGKLPDRLKCFANLVEGCKEGITVKLWVKINKSDLPGESYILSTGEQDTMSTGVSVFIREQNLFVGVGRGTRVKKVAITKDKLPLNKWTMIEASWSPDYPLWVAVDNEVLVMDNRGRYQRRKTNWFARPVIGRENSDAKTFSGFADFDFQYASYVGTYKPSDVLSRDLNPFYKVAAFFWERKTLITSTLPLLEKTGKLNGKVPGPSDKGVKVENTYVSITLPESKIILGTFKDECVSDPELCTNGLTVSAWLRVINISEFDTTLMSSTKTSPIQLLKKLTETGFQVSITSKAKGQVLQVSLRTKANLWEVTSTTVAPMNEWFNIGFTWSSSSGLALVLNAKKIGESTTPVAQANTAGTNTLAISNDDGVAVKLDVYNTAIWDSATPDTKLTNLVGMKADHFKKTQTYDYFYPFDKPWTDLTEPRSELKSDATYGTDRFGKRAGKTKKIGNIFPYISLGNHSTGCVVDPSLCSKAVLIGMYLHMHEGNQGTLFSSGAQAKDNRGFLIEQVGAKGDVLNVTVADGKKVWWKTCSANTRKWFYFQMKWTPTKGITVYQDGWEITAISENETAEVRAKMDYPIVILGRNNDNPYTGIVDAEYDDITFKYVKGSDSIPTVDAVKESCYDTVDEIQYVDKTDKLTLSKGEWVADRYNTTTGLNLTGGFVKIGDYKGKCVSDPSLCKDGVTVSFWTLLNNLTTTEGFLFSSGAPQSRGIAVTAKLDAGSAALNFIVKTATDRWEKSGLLAVTAETGWINLGLTWKSDEGLKIFFNGTLTGETTTKKSQLTAVADTHTDVFLGKPSFANASYANAVFDDLAIWNRALPALKRSKFLRGLCGDVILTVDPNAFTPPPTTTTTPMPTTPWVQPTDIECKEWKCMICASCEYKAVDASYARIDFNYPSVNKTCIVEILKKCMANGHRLPLKVSSDLIKGINATSIKTMDEKKIKAVKDTYYDAADNILDEKNDAALNVNQDQVYNYMVGVQEFTRRLSTDVSCRQSYRYETNFVTASFTSTISCKETRKVFPNMTDNSIESQVKKVGLRNGIRFAFKNKTDKHSSKRQTTISIFTSVSNNLPLITSNQVNESKVMINCNPFVLDTYPPLEPGDTFCFTLDHKESTKYKDEKMNPKEMDTICSYYEFDRHGKATPWKTKGVKKGKSTVDYTECCSSHTTVFAVLMHPIPVRIPSVHEEVLRVLTYIGLTISLISLLIFFFLIVLNPNLITERNVIHLNLILAMIIAQFIFLISEVVKKEKHLCQALAILIHYFFLTAFCWLWIEGLFLFYAVTSGIMKGRLKCYIPFAWGVPLVIVSAAVGMNVNAYGSEWKCWLNADGNHIYTFIGPILFLIALNACVMMIVLCNLATPAIKREDTLFEVRKATKHTILLIPVLGLTWVLGLLSVFDPTWTLLYFHVILNSLQGFFIFLFYCVGTKELRDKLFCRRGGSSDTSSLTSKGSGSLENLVSKEKATEVFYLNPLPGTSSDYVPVKPQPKSRPVTPLTTPRKMQEPPPLSPPPVYSGMPSVETTEKKTEDLTSHDVPDVETLNL